MFAVLAEAGFIDDALRNSLQGAARCRNLLVHQYAEADDRRVLGVLRTRLVDFQAFEAAIAAAALTEQGS